MERTKVKKLARQIRGVSYKPEDLHDSLDDNAVTLLRANNIDDGKINFDDVVYVDKSKVSDDQYLLPGDILICASSGSKQLVGKAASVAFGKPCTFGAFCKVVRPNSGMERYLGTYFQSGIYRREISAVAIGANINNIRNEHIDALELPIYSNDESKSIVTRMELLQRIIDKRKTELDKLDELIKARFVELFGNIKTNEFGWERCIFKDVSTKITDGEHGTVPRVNEDEGFLYFMARNITKDGEIDLSETSFVPKEIHEKIYKRCNPEKNDLLLVCVGATIGKCALVPEAMKAFSMARSVALIKPNKDKVTSTFLINLLRSEEIQKDIDQCSHAAAQAGLYTNMINNLDAFVPPMKLQMEFEAFCKQVDKSKVAVQKALDEAQLLFDSLMQEYFG